MELEEITQASAIGELADEWRHLLCDSPDGQIFDSPLWYQAWFEAFGENKRPRVLKITHGGSLAGVVPLVASRVWRRPWLSMHHVHMEDLQFLAGTRRYGRLLPMRQLSAAVNLQSGAVRGGWVIRPGLELAVLTTVAHHLNSLDDWDLLVLPGARDRDLAVFGEAMRAGKLMVESRPTVHTLFSFSPLPWEEFRASRSGHFRQRFNVSMREMDRLGKVEAKTVTGEQEIPAALDEMFALAARGRKQFPRKGQAWFLPVTQPGRIFYQGLAERYVHTGGCAIHQIIVDGAVMAAMLTITESDTLFALQMYYAPEAARASPGRLLMREAIEWSAQNGIKKIDMNGNSAFVRYFAKEPTGYGQAWVFRGRGTALGLHKLMLGMEWARTRLRKAPSHGE